MGSPFSIDATNPESTPTKSAGRNLVLAGGDDLASVHTQPPVSSGSAENSATTMWWILMDGHLSWRTTMKLLYATLSAAAFTLSLAGTAGAVDLHNTSDHEYSYDYVTVTVTENGHSRQVTIGDNETIHDICTTCTIKLESGQEVQASGADMVETNGDSMKVAQYPLGGRERAQLPSAGMGSGQEASDRVFFTMPGNDPITGGSEGGED